MKNIGYIEISMNGFGFLKDCKNGKQYFIHRSNFYGSSNEKNQKLGSKVLGSYVEYEVGIDNKNNRIVAINVRLIENIDTKDFVYLPESNYYNINRDSKSKGTFNLDKLNSKKENLDLNKINNTYENELKKEDFYIGGYVIKFDKNNGIGILKDEEGIDRQFKLNSVVGKIVLRNGDKIIFKPSTNQKGTYYANDILKIEHSELNTEKIALYKETRKWKLQAKMENMNNLFYEIDEYEQIKNGEKAFVIGRKGSGKSAISEYIISQKKYNLFFEELRLGNFSFSDVADIINDENENSNNEFNYVLIWKYIIYGTILKLMSKNNSIDSEIKELLSKVFPENPWESKSYSRSIKNWKFKELTLGYENFAGVKLEKENNINTFSLIEKVNFLENIIKKHIDNDTQYFVIFDEVQDDLYDNELRIEAVKKLRALLRSISEIKIEFKDNINQILPIIFLRDDSYELIDYNDKDKWKDFTISLNWTESKIKKMLAHRISRTSKCENILGFDKAWELYFPEKYAKTAFGNKEVFDIVSKHTFLRPRDFIDFFITSCNKAINSDTDDLQKVYFSSLRELSKSIRESIESEIRSLLININEIMNILSQQRLKAFTFKTFEKEYNEIFEDNDKTYDAKKVIEILFEFSVIGNVPYYNQEIFKYRSIKSEVNFSEPFIIHKSLFNSLNLY